MNREIAFLALAFILLTGSVKLQSEQKAAIDGSLSTVLLIETTSPADSFDLCANLHQSFQARGTVLSFECTTSEGLKTTVAILEQLPADIFYRQEGAFSTRYFFDLGKYNEIVSLLANGQFDPLALAQDANYSIRMPGTIIRTTVGSIQNNSVAISFSDTSILNNPGVEKIIESDEPSVILFVLLGVLVIAALGVFALLIHIFVVKKQKISSEKIPLPHKHLFSLKLFSFFKKNDSVAPKQKVPSLQKLAPRANSSNQMSIFSSEEEDDIETLVGALKKDKQKYSPDQIRQVILEKGYSKIVADEAVKRLFG